MAKIRITKKRTKKNGNSKGIATKKIKTAKTNYVVVAKKKKK